MGSEELVNVYESKLEGSNRRGRPLGRWKDKVEGTWEREVSVRGECKVIMIMITNKMRSL